MPFGPQGLYRRIPTLCWQAAPQVERVLAQAPAGARVVDSYVGPYTSIDRDVEIIGSEVEHSILLAGASVRDLV